MTPYQQMVADGDLDVRHGSIKEFKANWQRPEAEYCHFTRGEPENQIQFAFRQNWLEFAKIMEPLKPWVDKMNPLKPWAGRKSLEVGAGRGTMSMYFADNGFDCTLLDACEKPLEQAHKNFERHGLYCHCHVGDALKLPFEDESFDVVFSYGLMEHFDDIAAAFREQRRVLKKDGCLIAYVVPDEPNQSSAIWRVVNELLPQPEAPKEAVYRNRISQLSYWGTLHDLGMCADMTTVYPFPMLSRSGGFPFTLNEPELEKRIVDAFAECLRREDIEWRDCYRWQAFIVWGWKR